MATITVFISEKPMPVDGRITAFQLKAQVKPDADIVVYNGAPIAKDRCLHDGDSLVFIQRGEIPTQQELQALMAARHTPGLHQKFQSGSVGIAGLGGLGSTVAIALARVGVGKLVLVDFDVVEPSNLNRQQYFVDQIGMQKTDALAATLARVNPYVRLELHPIRLTTENIPHVFKDCSIIVEAFDDEMQKSMLVETVMKFLPDKILVTASGVAGIEDANLIVTKAITPHFYVCGDQTSAAAPGNGLMAPRVGVAAHHQANMVVRLLADYRDKR